MALISGGRINIWNVVKKQFEVVHPETETARITDFADGIVQKLALTSTMTAVTALQTDSWFGRLSWQSEERASGGCWCRCTAGAW